MSEMQPRGRWPRVNFVLLTEDDYGEGIATAGSEPDHRRAIRLHMEVVLRASEAARVSSHLGKGKLVEARKVVMAAMDRVVRRSQKAGSRGRAFVRAALSGRVPQLQPRGRWPRVNFVVASDYADTIALGSKAPDPTLSVHMDVELTRSETAEVARLLGVRSPKLAAARRVVEGAMDRIVPPGAPEGRRGRALVVAAFSK